MNFINYLGIVFKKQSQEIIKIIFSFNLNNKTSKILILKIWSAGQIKRLRKILMRIICSWKLIQVNSNIKNSYYGNIEFTILHFIIKNYLLILLVYLKAIIMAKSSRLTNIIIILIKQYFLLIMSIRFY